MRIPTLDEFKGICLNEHCQGKKVKKRTRWKEDPLLGECNEEIIDGLPMIIEEYYECLECGVTSDTDPCLFNDGYEWKYRSGRIFRHGKV